MAAGALWKQAFGLAVDDTRDMPEELGARLAQEWSLRRFCFNSFRAERKLPTPRDFVLAIAFECQLRYVKVPAEVVEQYGRLVWQHWYRRIQNFGPSAKHFESERGMSPAAVLRSPQAVPEDVRAFIRDPRECERAYFRSYATPDGTESLQVWLQGGRGWNDHTITVDVPVLSSRGLESGFFRLGYNYFLHRNGGLVSLNGAYQGRAPGDETGDFPGLDIGYRSSRALWIS